MSYDEWKTTEPEQFDDLLPCARCGQPSEENLCGICAEEVEREDGLG